MTTAPATSAPRKPTAGTRHALAMEYFATGRGQHVLCLQVHTDFVWGGLYASRSAGAPLAIGVTLGLHRVTTEPNRLGLGDAQFVLGTSPLRKATDWLARNGVTVRETQP